MPGKILQKKYFKLSTTLPRASPLSLRGTCLTQENKNCKNKIIQPTILEPQQQKKDQTHFFHSTGKQKTPNEHPTYLLRNETINTALPRPHLPAMHGLVV